MEDKKYRRGNKKRLRLNAARKKCNLRKKSQTWSSPMVYTTDNPTQVPIEMDLTETTSTQTYSKDTKEQNQDYNFSSTNTSASSSPINIEFSQNMEEPVSKDIAGRRIVDIAHIFESIKKIDHSPFECNFSYLDFEKEIRIGAISTFYFKCRMCNKSEVISAEDPEAKINTNLALVEAAICTGNGFSQLEEISATLNMPCMSKRTFYNLESKLQETLQDCALDEMLAAGEEEKRLALLNGDVDSEGYALVPVVADGSWPKRSFKSGYSSLSGCAYIIGYRTKKVLFFGIRNTYCCICDRAKTKGLTIPEHVCFRNWSNSATSMEEDIIVEGFQRSIEMHGIKYNMLIGDGDSGIISKLLMTMPYGPNLLVQKVECKNHLLRNFCNKIKQLGKKTNNFKGYVPVPLRKTVEANVLRLRKSIVGAINYRKTENLPNSEKIDNLKNDIKNCADHVFGNHTRCNDYFCRHPTEKNFVPELLSTGVWTDIQKHVTYLVNNAKSLILDVTNNSAEQFNSVIAKFIGGKRVNFTSRGSYQGRCFGAVTSWNSQNQTHYKIQKKITQTSPGPYTKKFVDKSKKLRGAVKKRRLDLANASQTHSKKKKRCEPDQHYGVLELEEDLPEDEYENKKSNFLASLVKTKEEIKQLEKNTRGQSDNNIWLTERRKRITAFRFGKICKMRKSTSSFCTLKDLLYSNFKGSKETQYGKQHESEAIRDFSRITNLQVTPCGLFIHIDDCYLGASPDGLIGDDSLIEVKCPYTASNMTPMEGIQNKVIKCCQTIENKMVLKRNHDYYYQVQGQLQITGRKFCYFTIWTPLGLQYEKIERDDEFWAQQMQPKLENFYFECILPEIIDPRIPRNLPVRERTI